MASKRPAVTWKFRQIAIARRSGNNFGLLSPEIIDTIIDYLSLDTLRQCRLVCRLWNVLAKDKMNRRIALLETLIPRITLDEIRFNTLLPYNPDNYRLTPIEESAEIKKRNDSILSSYERSHCEISQVVLTDAGDKPSDITKTWLSSVSDLRSCSCDDGVACLVIGLRFMPSYDLIFVVMKHSLAVFKCDDPVNSLKDPSKFIPYTNIRLWMEELSPDAHGPISIHQDSLVTLISRRCFLYTSVHRVMHRNRSVEFKKGKCIYTPFWIEDLTIYKRKVYILYSTGQVGLWKVNPEILYPPQYIATIKVSGDIPNQYFSRLNNLILIRQVNDADTEGVWTMVHHDHERVQTFKVPLVDLVNAVHPGTGVCNHVSRAEIWKNYFILHYIVQEEDSQQERKIMSVLRMKRDPVLEDFQSMEKFQDLFHTNPPGQTPFHFDGIISSPFPVLSRRNGGVDTYQVANILALRPNQVPEDNSIYNLSVHCR